MIKSAPAVRMRLAGPGASHFFEESLVTPDDIDELAYTMDSITDDEVNALADELFQMLDRDEQIEDSAAR
jgi:hypothetical protein